MIVVGKVPEGRQIIALRMAGEGDASFKDAGSMHKGQGIIVWNMVAADASI
jgi:hypothetical protein